MLSFGIKKYENEIDVAVFAKIMKEIENFNDRNHHYP